jgi:hypothetical protein
MPDRIISPDGNSMWSGSEWIPVPPTSRSQSANVSLQDSVITGDVTISHNINEGGNECPNCKSTNVKVMICKHSDCSRKFCELCNSKCRVSIFQTPSMADEFDISSSIIAPNVNYINTHNFDSGDGEGMFCSACIDQIQVTTNRERKNIEEKAIADDKIIEKLVDDWFWEGKKKYQRLKLISLAIAIPLLFLFSSTGLWLMFIVSGLISLFTISYLHKEYQYYSKEGFRTHLNIQTGKIEISDRERMVVKTEMQVLHTEIKR